MIVIMKKTLLPTLFVIGLLCGCIFKSGEQSGILSNGVVSEEAAKFLSIMPGYERRVEKMNLSGFSGEISAAQARDNRLWFVSGQVLYSANFDGSDVQEVFGSLPDDTQYITFGSEGDIYFGTANSVFVFTKEGKTKSQLLLDSSQQIQRLADLASSFDRDVVALICSDRDGYRVRTITDDSFGDEIDFTFPVNTEVHGITFYNEAMFLTTGDGLFEYSETAVFPILIWSDIGVKSREPYIVAINENESIIYLNRYDGSLYIIQSMPKISEKIELTLAYVNANGIVPAPFNEAVATFNGSSNEYKVKITAINSLEQLNIQIIAGDIPDLIQVHYPFPFESYVTKGIFEDLNPYFEDDPEVTLVPAVHRIMSTDDKLFRVVPGFSAMTLIGHSNYVGTENGWTFEEMKQCLANAPEGSTIFPDFWNKEIILLFLLYQNIDEFIDWESGKALFDTPDFKELLELANSHSGIPPEFSSDKPMVLEGRELIIHDTFMTLEHFVNMDNFMGGKAVYKGFPSSKKNSGILFPTELTLAMTSACANKDGAWNFLRTMLLTDKNIQTIPAVQSKFDLAVKLAMTPGRFNVNPITKEQLDIVVMTQGQYEKFINFLNGMGPVISGNLALQTIIEEEVQAYFEGQKSVDEVCKIIQNRAQTYVSEQS